MGFIATWSDIRTVDYLKVKITSLTSEFSRRLSSMVWLPTTLHSQPLRRRPSHRRRQSQGNVFIASIRMTKCPPPGCAACVDTTSLFVTTAWRVILSRASTIAKLTCTSDAILSLVRFICHSSCYRIIELLYYDECPL